MPETISKSLKWYRAKYPEGKITTTPIMVKGKKYSLPSIKTTSNWKGFIKFIQEWKQNPTIENFVRLSNKLDKGAQETTRDFRKWLRGEPLGYGKIKRGGETSKVFEAINKDLNLNTSQVSKLKSYTRPIVAAEVVRLKATPRAAETALGESAERIRRLNTIFKENPNISLRGIAAKLNGRAFAMGNNAARLAMATEASNGVALYLTALQKGREMKNWVPPTGKIS